MNLHPFDSHELGRDDPDLGRVADALERYADDAGGEPPVDLAFRIRSAVDAEPIRRGPFALLATWRRPVRLLTAAVVVLAAVVGAVALGDLADRARTDLGTSPSPSTVSTPTPIPTPTPTPTPTPAPTVTPSPSASPTVTPSDTAEPSATDDGGGVETPEPSESDNSGPGGGGGSDNSGPGSGGDDSG